MKYRHLGTDFVVTDEGWRWLKVSDFHVGWRKPGHIPSIQLHSLTNLSPPLISLATLSSFPPGEAKAAAPLGSPSWRPLPGSKAFGLQQPTGYHLFTIHSYLLLSPTQVGDAGWVREPTDRYRLRASLSGGTAAPLCISFREVWPRLVFFTFTGYNALVTFLKGAFRCKQKKMK